MNSPIPIKNHSVNSLRSSRFALFALVWLIGLAFGTAYYACYYPMIFHSDSASIQVLAQAMLDEMSLLPHDFYYGNQLILFRANLFIASGLKLGLTGYIAYTVGSAINFAMFFLIAFLTLEMLFDYWVKSLLLTILLFLPLGINEASYVLGEQSHLANVVFALMIAVHSYRACWLNDWRALIIGALVVFLMAVEAPMRALFVLLPLAIVILATSKAKSSMKLGLALTIAFVVGYICNRYLVTTHPVATDISDLAFSTSDRFFIRMGIILKDFVDNYLGFMQFVGMKSSSRIHLVLYGVKTLVLLTFLGLFYWFAKRLAARAKESWMISKGETQGELQALEFIGLLGVTGVLTGFWITSALEYDGYLLLRHSEGMLQLCKLALCAYSLKALAYLIPQRLPHYGVLFILALLSSSVASSFLFAPYRAQLQQNIDHTTNLPIFLFEPYHRPLSLQGIDRKTTLPIDSKIQELMHVHRINRIYGGDFWSTLRLEVLIPPAKAAVLSVWGDNIHFFKWLSRPSMRCITGNVLYLLDRSKVKEEFISRKVLASGGRILERFDDTGIYIGDPVWDQAGCTS